MDEEPNDLPPLPQAPIVVDETETVNFDHKDMEEDLPLPVDTKPQEQEQTTEVTAEEVRGETCCDKFLRCLSHVPCASLIAWIILFLGLGGLTGSLLIGTYKTRDLLDHAAMPQTRQYRVVNNTNSNVSDTVTVLEEMDTPKPFVDKQSDGNDVSLWFVEWMLLGVVVSMFVLGTLFLICGHLSTDPTSRRVFHSSAKNRCARGLNIFLLIFIYFLTLVWILALLLLAVPLVILSMFFLAKDMNGLTCISLENYGFTIDRQICDEQLDVFALKAKDVLICYAAGYFSALLIVLSLINFLISISANITHLKDNRFITLNAYETEDHSKHSVLDTNM